MAASDKENPALGRVEYLERGEVQTVTLHSDGTWTGRDMLTVGTLNSLYTLDDSSPADGRRGAKELGAAAKLLTGVVFMPPATQHDEPGTVY